jgi:predicted MPP superfamily phosphohydrolase
VYNGASFLERIVKKINKEEIDALLIAGDFIYEPRLEHLKKLFLPLAKIQVPIYVVLGNHDSKKSDLSIEAKLEKVLSELEINVITNRAIELNGITILGLGSHMMSYDKIDLLQKYHKDDNVIVLAHNPDTTLKYKSPFYPALTLVGHTHGGQIRIPYVYKKVIKHRGKYPWNQGLYTFKNTKVFVTSGVGEVGLPLRFLIPPVIDILTLY